MPDILHDFPVKAPRHAVLYMFTAAAGLDAWWTLRSQGTAALGEVYSLDFGPGFEWTARVSAFVPDQLFELTLEAAMPDWVGTRVRAQLEESGDGTLLRFSHTGWAEASPHFRQTSFCWAMYLRLLRRHVEEGEVVPYERRLDV